jgi:hypothetical protein
MTNKKRSRRRNLALKIFGQHLRKKNDEKNIKYKIILNLLLIWNMIIITLFSSFGLAILCWIFTGQLLFGNCLYCLLNLLLLINNANFAHRVKLPKLTHESFYFKIFRIYINGWEMYNSAWWWLKFGVEI